MFKNLEIGPTTDDDDDDEARWRNDCEPLKSVWPRGLSGPTSGLNVLNRNNIPVVLLSVSGASQSEGNMSNCVSCTLWNVSPSHPPRAVRQGPGTNGPISNSITAQINPG